MKWMTVAGIVLLGLALLAYKWTYTNSLWDPNGRRNRQWVLIVALVTAAALLITFDAGVLS